MTPLAKRLPRDFVHNLGKYLGIFVLMTFAISFTSGYLSAAASMQEMCDGIRERYNVEDLYITTLYAMDEDDIAALEDMGMHVYENFSRDVPATVTGYDGDISVRVYRNRAEAFDQAVYNAGRAPENPGEVALDRVFCQNHNLEVGDTVTIADEDMELVGIMILTDYTATYKSSGDFMFNAVSFTVAQLADEDYERIVGDGETFTYSILLDDRDMSLPDRTSLEEDLVDELIDRGVTVTNLIDAESNIGLTFAPSDIEGDAAMWTTLLFILIVIMAFVFVVLTDATIEEESPVIGTLLASGYRKRELVAHYLVLPTIVGLIAIVIGNILGATLLTLPMKDLYYHSYSLPPFEYVWHWEVFALTSIAPFAVLELITLLGMLRKLGATPLQFLRHEAGGKKPLRGTLALPDALPYASRFRIRLFLRNLSHFATLFLGIVFGSILLLMGLCLMPIVDVNAELMANDVPAEHIYLLKGQLEIDATDDERAAWAAAEELATNPDYEALDLDGLSEMAEEEGMTAVAIELMTNPDYEDLDLEELGSLLEDLTKVDELENPINQTAVDDTTLEQVEKLTVGSLSATRTLGGGQEELTIYGIAEGSRYWPELDVSGGKILIGEGVAQKCGARAGEELTLTNRFTNETYTVTPTATCGNGTTMAIYMSQGTLNDLLGNDEGYFNAYASDKELPLDERYLASEITPDKMLSMSAQMQESMGSLMSMIVVMVVPIYLVLIYLLTKTVIDRSARSISYMKVFGYHDLEIDGLYVRAITVTVVASLVLCLPVIQAAVNAIVPVLLARFSGNFVMVYPAYLMAEIVAIGIGTYAVVAVLHLLRIRRVSLALAMKVQE